jgi:UMF1 family MFS transporter
MWLGPLLIEAATRIGGTQALGLTPILGMLGVGWLLLFAVRGGGPVR